MNDTRFKFYSLKELSENPEIRKIKMVDNYKDPRILKYYWCVKVKEHISPDKEIYVYSDKVKIVDGNLIFEDKDDHPVFSISKGNWDVFFAASCFDGSAYYVEYWTGELNRYKEEGD